MAGWHNKKPSGRLGVGGAQGSMGSGKPDEVRRTVGEESMRKAVLLRPFYTGKLRYREAKY